MFQHVVYKCPKCMNILLVSNKMLHDLRCTIDNPATYENVLYRQSQQMANDGAENYKCPNSAQRLSSRMSITNDDGTMIDIKKEKNFRGIEEYIETKYDKETKIIISMNLMNITNMMTTITTQIMTIIIIPITK